MRIVTRSSPALARELPPSAGPQSPTDSPPLYARFTPDYTQYLRRTQKALCCSHTPAGHPTSVRSGTRTVASEQSYRRIQCVSYYTFNARTHSSLHIDLAALALPICAYNATLVASTFTIYTVLSCSLFPSAWLEKMAQSRSHPESRALPPGRQFTPDLRLLCPSFYVHCAGGLAVMSRSCADSGRLCAN
jgi:hypothetical protein